MMYRPFKLLATFAILLGSLTVSAKDAVLLPDATSNWSIGVDAGGITPLSRGNFVGNFRPAVGLNFGKQFTPAFALGAEASWTVNTSNWPGRTYSPTAFDGSYVGAFGSLDLLCLGNRWKPRFFGFGLTAGCGWGHLYLASPNRDRNFFMAKAGLMVNFNISRRITLALKPSILWKHSTNNVSFGSRRALFALQAGLRYNFGPGFTAARLYDAAEVDALNGEVNDLRGQLDACRKANADAQDLIAAMNADLEEARNQRPEVVREVLVNNRLNTVLDVFFHVGSASVTADQMPNVQRIADYLKNHPGSRVVIKGYASRDGNRESNLRLAQKRAEAVRDQLILRYKIAASRITAEGAGIGEMFEEDSWNRVSVCTLEDK